MLRKITHLKRVTGARTVHQWQHPQIHTNQPTKALFYIPKTPFSSSSSKNTSSLHNYYLNKRQKWPTQPYEIQYSHSFASQLAKQSFKQSIKKSKTNLLSTLIDSFAIYEIDPTPQAYRFLFQVMIQNRALNYQIPQILDHIEKVENLETPECIFIDLIKFYGSKSMLNEALELFFRIPKFRCDPSVKSLNVLLLVLCRDEIGLKLIPEILIKTQEMNIRIEESSFWILIRALCKIGKVKNAFQLLYSMEDEGIFIDQNIFSLILATKSREENDGEIMGFLWDLKMFGFEPRKDDMCNVIRCLVKKGKSMHALKLLRQMKNDGVKPDLMCYNLIMDGFILEEEFPRADKLFDELLLLGLVPDIQTYNVYIWGLCMQKKIEEGIKMLASMEDLGCAPSLNTYISILCAFCKAGELDRVRETMNAMKKNGIQLNLDTYEIMIDRLVRNDNIDGACGFLNQMLENNFVPSPTTLDKIICWFCNNDFYFKAVELLEEVVEKGISPGDEAWHALIHGSGITFKNVVDLSMTTEPKDCKSLPLVTLNV